jgi:alpha-galactosidase
MKTTIWLIAVATFVLLPLPFALATAPTSGEMSAARQWTATRFEAAKETKIIAPAFSFTYDGKPSGELLNTWELKPASRTLDQQRTEHTLTFTDPKTGLVVRCIGVAYRDFPAVEWTVFFKNTGTADTPIIADIRAIDAGVPLARDKQAVVRYATGSECRTDDFAPQVAPLGSNANAPQGPWVGEGNSVRLQSKEGRSSCGTLPFFNVDAGAQGVICAIGWTGDWAANVYRTDSEVRMRAGMPRTHLKLLPGEEIRSPRIAMLFWAGDSVRGQNLWRRFVLAHHAPQKGGKPARVPVCFGTWGGNFAQKHIEHGQWWKDHNLAIDFLWIDAGWYGKDEPKLGANVFNSKWGELVGDWFPNPGYFPQGLGPVGKALKDMGMGFLLWFEPERVFQGTTWSRQHPEYLLGPVGPNYLYNLGNPAARQALTDQLVKVINEGNISCYRQDFNFDPRPYWDKADAPDRVGMTEIGHITGLYRMWDDLLARCPGLLIDNCASGGRRIDIETMSRSIPLWRSDLPCYPGYSGATIQNETHGLGLWAPLNTGVCDREDTYMFRSAMGPGLCFGMPDFEKDTNKHFAIDWIRKRFGELDQVRDLFLGDFYPLMAYTASEDAWAAWQFDRPDLNSGAVLAFRRTRSPFGSATLTLKGLEPTAIYTLRNLDAAGSTEMTGRELAEKGLAVTIKDQPGSAVIIYKKKP